MSNTSTPNRVKFLGYSGDAVDLEPYGLDHPAVYDLETLQVASQRMPMNYNHRTRIGETERVSNTKQVIRGTGSITEENKAAKRVLNATSRFEASMGLDVRRAKITFHRDSLEANGQTFEGPHYFIQNAVLDEMTITEEGRDPMTKVHKLSRMELSKIKGKKRPAQRRTVDHNINLNIRNSKRRRRPADDPPDTERRNELSYTQIRRLEEKYPDYIDVILNGADEGWSFKRIENTVKLQAAEDRLPTPPEVETEDGVDLLEARLAATLCKEPDKTLEKHYGEEVRDRVLNMGNIGLKELMVLGANRLGGNYTGYSDIEGLVDFIGRANTGRIHNTGFSTFSMPNLFRRVTEMVMEESWKIEDFFAPSRCFPTSHNDFKTQERFRPSGGTMWEGLDKNGRVKHGHLGAENRYLAKLDTKAQMLGFNRELIENDDMGVIQEILDLMVEGGLMVPDVKLVKHMLANVDGFWKDSGTTQNHFAGASYALSASALSELYLRAQKLVINKGKVDWVNQLTDRWAIVVPPELEETAWEIIKQSRLLANDATTGKQGDANYWFNKMDIWKFNQLSNTTIATELAPTATRWFLWPTNTRFAPFAISYLRGRRRPIVRVREAPVDMLGFVVVGVFDVEINDREPQAIIRAQP